MALAYRRYSLDYVDEEADAQAARRGVWAGEFMRPWEWRRGKRLETTAPEACIACDLRHKRLLKRSEKCAIKGNINRKGERIYHMPSGQWYGRTRIDSAKGAGVSDRLWEIGDIVKLIKDAEVKPGKRGPYNKHNAN